MALPLADQAIVSASNFTTTVLLARYLGPEQFGRFILLWTAVLVLQGVAAALVAQPVRVLGVGKLEGQDGRYAASVGWLQSAVAVSLAATGYVVLVTTKLGTPTEGLAVAACIGATQLLECSRACAQAKLDLETLLRIDAVTHASRLILLLLLGAVGLLSVGWTLAAITAGCAAGLALRFPWKLRTSVGVGDIAALGWAHWRYGRWLLIESIAFTASNQIYVYLIALWLSAEAAGGFAAVQSVLNVTNVVLFAAMGILAPIARRKLIREGVGEWRAFLAGVGTALVGVMAALVATASLIAAPLLGAVFGAQYSSYAGVLPVLGLATVLNGATAVLSEAFRTAEQPNVGFKARATSGVIAPLAAYPLVVWLGVTGAALGLVLTQVIWLLVYFAEIFVRGTLSESRLRHLVAAGTAPDGIGKKPALQG